MDRGSKFGQKSAEDAWKSSEADALYKLHAAGVRLPTPVMFIDVFLLMENRGHAHRRRSTYERDPQKQTARDTPMRAATAHCERRFFPRCCTWRDDRNGLHELGREEPPRALPLPRPAPLAHVPHRHRAQSAAAPGRRARARSHDHELLAARDRRVGKVALQHGEVVAAEREHDHRVLAALRLVHGERVGELQLLDAFALVLEALAFELDDDVKLDDLAWCEIYDEAHLRRALDQILPAINDRDSG